MGNLSVFQITLIAVFGIIGVLGVVVFATGFRGGGSEVLPEVVIWGTLPQETMDTLIEELRDDDPRFAALSYVEKAEETYDSEFIDALASGQSPDLFLLSEDRILTHKDKLIEVPFDVYSERIFKNTFAEAGESYLTDTGVLGLPFTIDPLVMYWNRDIWSDEGIANPPSFWDEFFTLSPRITQRDRSSNIVRSFVAFGEFRNVVHAKDILSALILQTGNPILEVTERGVVSRLLEKYNFLELPALAALRFYTEFSNPIKSVYSWNRALPDSRQSFIAGDLALYIGFASEYERLESANPNLNFDVALLPRSRDAKRSLTLSHMRAFAIPRGSRDSAAAFAVASALTSPKYALRIGELLALPPVRRDVLEEKPADAVGPVFYNSAIVSKQWLDPNPQATDALFERMIESVVSGRLLLNEAIQAADEELKVLLQ